MIKRIVATLLALVLMAALFSGCHGAVARDAFAVPEKFDTTKNHEITFWAKNDTNLSQVEVYKRAISEFEELYPNVKVNLRLYTDYGRLYNDVITNIATNTTPNVCITYPDHVATYLTGENCVVPLDDLMCDPEYGMGGSEVRFDAPTVEEMVPEFMAEGVLGNTQYALPYMRSTEACYINKDYVEKLGYTVPDVLTWDFIWEVSEAATKKNADGTFAVNGQNIMIPFVYKSTDNMMIQMLKQLDAPYSTAGGTIEVFNDTTKELLYTVAEHVKTGAFSTFKIESYPADLLNAGQCIFAIDSTAGATWMGPDAPLMDISPDKIVDFEVAVRPIPQADPENPQMISQGPSMCLFNKEDPQEVLASWLFAQYLLTDTIQIGYSQTEGYAPVTLKAQQSEEYLDYLSRSGEDDKLYYSVKLDATKLLMEYTDHTFVTPVFNGSASLRDAAGQMIENVARSVRRKETINEAYMEKLFADVAALHRLDQVETTDLGPLPDTAVWLLTALGVTWLSLGVWAAAQKFRRKKV